MVEYRVAGSLYPSAQAPRLAQSQLASCRAAISRAARATLSGLPSTNHAAASVDPWWSYFVSQAEGAPALLADARSRLATPHRAVP